MTEDFLSSCKFKGFNLPNDIDMHRDIYELSQREGVKYSYSKILELYNKALYCIIRKKFIRSTQTQQAYPKND